MSASKGHSADRPLLSDGLTPPRYTKYIKQTTPMASFADYVASRPAAEQAQADILHYTEVLMEALTQDAPEGYTYAIDGGRKYHKVWMYRNGKRDSIHAFVDKKTGDVLKPASTKAPAKGVRFNLLDEASREDMLSRVGWSGGYLYLTH